MKHAVWITRGEHWWFDSRDQAPLEESEWEEYLKVDKEFRAITRMIGYCPYNQFKIVSTECKGYYVWMGHSRYRPNWEEEMAAANDERRFFELSDGQWFFEYNRNGICVRRPDAEVLEKAKTVAQVLGARVIGDDDERY
jgi:hypothetical protein